MSAQTAVGSKFLQLPKRPWILGVFALVLWIAHPFLSKDYFIVTQALGYYPPEADSIGIPIYAGFLCSALFFPLWFALWSASLRQYPGSTPLFVSGKGLPWKIRTVSFFLWALSGLALTFVRDDLKLFLEIKSSVEAEDAAHLGLYMMLQSLSWAFMWLVIRAIFIAKAHRKKAGLEPRKPLKPYRPPKSKLLPQ